ncbi:MAG: tetratricopeptide repeat protein [Bacteroidota bacterium]
MHRLTYFAFSLFLGLSVISFAQPGSVSEKDIQIQKVFIEASKEKLLGNYDDAIFLFNEVLHKDKNNHAARYELAQLYYAAKKTNDAIGQIEKALQQDKENEWYNLLYAHLLEESTRFEDAANVFDDLIQINPTNDEYFFEKAFLLTKANQLEGAIRTYDQLERKLGVNEELSSRKHGLWLTLGDKDQAGAELKKLSDTFPRETKYMVMLAEFYEKTGQKAEAAKLYEKVVELNPDEPNANLALAESFKAKGQHVKYLELMQPIFANPDIEIDLKVREMIQYIEPVSEQQDPALTDIVLEIGESITVAHPDQAKAFSLNGDLLFHAGQSDAAIMSYKGAIQLDKSVFTLWQQIFLIRAEQGQFQALLEETEEALDYFPNQPLVYFFSGLAHAQLNKHDDAIGFFEEALFMAGSNSGLKEEVYFHLGSSYHALQRHDESDQAFDNLLAINPNNALTLNNYSYFLSERGKELEKAAEMSAKANQLVPDQASFLDTYGWILYKQKKYKEAQKWMEKAFKAGGSKDPEILENYGDVLFQLNQVDKAVQMWEKSKVHGNTSEILIKKINDRKLYE